MDIAILNSIIFKELMPWNFVPGSLKVKNELIRKVNALEPVNNTELTAQVRQLITEYPALIKWLDKQPLKNETPITSHIHSSILPDYSDATSKYYALLVSKEKLRLYNAFLIRSNTWSNKIDIVYHTTIALKNIKALAKHTVKEIKDRGFEETTNVSSPLPHFVLHYLKQQLIELYFDIQEVNKASLDSTLSIEDFYLTELQLPITSIIKLEKNEIEQELAENKGHITQHKLSFGFTGDKEKLKAVISQLCNQIELLNEEKCTQDHLFKILTAKELNSNLPQIYIQCETVQFSYIVGELNKTYFKKFTPTTIERSALFYTTTSQPMKAQNLYSSKIDNPKTKEEIDNIINHLK